MDFKKMDLNKIIQGLAGSGVISGLAGGMAGGAVSGALMSKKGRKHAGTLLKVGGLAAVGGLAWKAYRGYQKSRSAPVVAPPAPPASLPTDDSREMLLLRAMIAAAMADGHIDRTEQARIFGRLAQLNLREQEKSLILDELRHPASMEALARECTDLTTGLEVYSASLLAIDASCPAGRVYLEDLAEQLALPQTLVRSVREQASPAGEDADQDRAA